MQVIHHIIEIQKKLKNSRKNGKTIGFVPTMGALHTGHLSLIQRSKAENDLTVCSIFVNPTQFNNPEDLNKYPRTLEIDSQLLEQAGCDLLFAPSVSEIYPSLPVLKIDFGILETVMEGKFRPGHFNGVGIVVAKLFNIVQADKAYFGLKDLQQVAVIKQLVKDLSFDLELIPCPTLRETDGLAMSSRNRRLSSKDRDLAPQIYKTLNMVRQHLEENTDAGESIKIGKIHLATFPDFSLEYLEVVDADTLLPLASRTGTGQTAICIAAFLGGVRLIDNIVF